MKDVYDKIIDFLNKIKREDKLVLVEGLKDKRVMHDFGIKRVKTLEKRALYKVVEEIKDKEVVMLVDLDKEGKKLFGKLRHDLIRHGIKIDDRFREFLFRKTKLRQIEGLKRFMERL